MQSKSKTDIGCYFNHLSPAVSTETAMGMKELSALILEGVVQRDFDSWPDAYGSASIEEIYGVAYDGYFPYTGGGFQVTEFYRSDPDPSYHFNKAQTDWVEETQEYCESLFLEYLKDKHPRRRQSDIQLGDKLNWNLLTDKEQEEYHEFESEMFTSCLLRIGVYQKDDKVVIFAEISYSDAPYYRGYDDRLMKKEFSIEEFNAEDKQNIVTCIVEAMKNAD